MGLGVTWVDDADADARRAAQASLITIRAAKRGVFSGRVKHELLHYAVTGSTRTLCGTKLGHTVVLDHAVHPVGQRCPAECERCRKVERRVRRAADRNRGRYPSGTYATMSVVGARIGTYHWDDYCTVCGRRLRKGSLPTMHKTCAGRQR
jgi:hypothetical protein